MSRSKKRKKTMTEAALAANRANAQKSTGPGEEGKKISRWNAFLHGGSGRFTLYEWEDKEEFTAFRTNMMMEYDPQGIAEYKLVQRLIHLTWRMERMEQYEADITLDSRYREDLMADLLKVSQYEFRMQRGLFQVSRELRLLRQERGITQRSVLPNHLILTPVQVSGHVAELLGARDAEKQAQGIEGPSIPLLEPKAEAELRSQIERAKAIMLTQHMSAYDSERYYKALGQLQSKRYADPPNPQKLADMEIGAVLSSYKEDFKNTPKPSPKPVSREEMGSFYTDYMNPPPHPDDPPQNTNKRGHSG